MRVKVRLFATLVNYVPGATPGVSFEVELPDGASVSDLMDRLNLPQEEVKVAFVNGRVEPVDFLLQHGHEVGIFPPIGGG